MNAATQVFHIPELLELILLFLPSDSIHAEIKSIRTILASRTASRTWHELIHSSTPLRQKLYLPTLLDSSESNVWLEKTPFPPAQPTPWIPQLLLNQRSWGSAWPFESIYVTAFDDGLTPSNPKFWTFSLELSRAQYSRLPVSGPWRQILATSPPFTDFWCTRSFYELGSGRAPFVTHLDYDGKKSKREQKYHKHCPNGVTLGDLVDAYGELFEKHTERAAKFVMAESVLCFPEGDTKDDTSRELERPTTKMYMPGMSAERSLAWKY